MEKKIKSDVGLRVVLLSGVLLVLPFAGCHSVEEPTGILAVGFTLYKGGGYPGSSFHTGEKFTMTLSITNRTGQIRRFYSLEPEAVLEILQNDSVLITSVDGRAFPLVVIPDSIMPNQIVTYSWLAPTSVYYPNGLRLPPGRYQARGTARLLSDEKSPVKEAVEDFSIIP